MNRAAADSHPRFTPRQGQYLAFIHAYTLVNERPPAQADIQRSFRLTPPWVYQMLLTLERDGLIFRRAGYRGVSPSWSIKLSCPHWSQRQLNQS